MSDDVLARARRLADEVLAPAAEEVDQAAVVPASHLEALAAAGLHGLAGPPDADGLDVDPHTFRRVVAAIGGACGATFFVWVQHHGVVRTIRSGRPAVAERLLGPLCRGELLAGTAFAHVRRVGPPAIRATRDGDGFRLHGRAPWATSWGLADLFSVAAVTDADVLVGCVVPGRDPAGVHAAPLPLPVFGATATVSLELESTLVPADDVIDVVDLEGWREADRRRAAMPQPASYGVASRAAALLAAFDDRAARAAASAVEQHLAELWNLDDELVDAALAGDDVIERAARLRARSLDLASRATRALLAAVGGRGMGLDHPAQRLAREAAFYVIQAQTGDGRAAVLAAVASAGS